jgi:hypothetical protein
MEQRSYTTYIQLFYSPYFPKAELQYTWQYFRHQKRQTYLLEKANIIYYPVSQYNHRRHKENNKVIALLCSSFPYDDYKIKSDCKQDNSIGTNKEIRKFTKHLSLHSRQIRWSTISCKKRCATHNNTLQLIPLLPV